MSQIKYIIIDDHLLFREGLKELLSNENDLQCVGIFDGSEDIVKVTNQLGVDVVLLDISMPNVDGIEIAKAIKDRCMHTSILVLTAYMYPDYIQAAIQAGVNGYLLKNTPRKQLVEAIRMVHDGEAVFCTRAAEMIRLGMAGDLSQDLRCKDLNKRETEVLRLVAKGLTNKSIASLLHISENTVGSHLSNIFKKLGAESRTEAALLAYKEGIARSGEFGEENQSS